MRSLAGVSRAARPRVSASDAQASQAAGLLGSSAIAALQTCSVFCRAIEARRRRALRSWNSASAASVTRQNSS